MPSLKQKISNIKSKYGTTPPVDQNYNTQLANTIKDIKEKFYTKKVSLEQKVKDRYGLSKADEKQYTKFNLGRFSEIPSHETTVEDHLQNLINLYNINKPKIDAHRKWAKETSKSKNEYKQKVARIDRYESYLLKGINAYKIALEVKHSKNPDWKKLLSDNNSKLIKEGIISMPNLPAGQSCPGRGSCGSGFCYGMVGLQNFKDSINKRGYAVGLTEHPDFIEKVTEILSNYPKIKSVSIDPDVYSWLKDTDRFKNILRSEPKEVSIFNKDTNKNEKKIQAKLQIGDYIRLHDTGDFYNQDYVNKIAEIAKRNPDKKFYAYTKSLHLDLDPLYNLDNFHVIQSAGGKHDDKIDYNKPHALILPEHVIREQGYTNVGDHDWPSASGENTKIGIPVHGTRSKEAPLKEFTKKLNKSEDPPDTDWHEIDQPDLPNQMRYNNKILFTVMEFVMKRKDKLKKTGYKPAKESDFKNKDLDYSNMNKIKTQESQSSLDYSKFNKPKQQEPQSSLDYSKFNKPQAPKWKERVEAKQAQPSSERDEARFKSLLQTKRREAGKGPTVKTAIETIQERSKKSDSRYGKLIKCLKKNNKLKKNFAAGYPMGSAGSTGTAALVKKDEIPGGYGDNKDLSNFDKKQLTLGMLIEMEHTNDFRKALEIAKDHLMEDSEYYTHLIQMEKENLSKGIQKLSKKQGVPKEVDPDKHERCVQSVKKQGHDKKSAIRICNTSLKKSRLIKSITLLKKDLKLVGDSKKPKKQRLTEEELRANMKKKPIMSGESRHTKIRRALDKQKDTNPYAQSGHQPQHNITTSSKPKKQSAKEKFDKRIEEGRKKNLEDRILSGKPTKKDTVISRTKAAIEAVTRNEPTPDNVIELKPKKDMKKADDNIISRKEALKNAINDHNKQKQQLDEAVKRGVEKIKKQCGVVKIFKAKKKQ